MLLSCLCAFVVTITSPQDSLLNLLNEAQRRGNFQLQSDYLNSIGFDLYWRHEYDSAIYRFRQALDLNTKLKDDTLAAQNRNNIGMVFYQTGVPDSALIYYERAYLVFRQHNLAVKAATTGLNLSMIYYDKGAYKKALELALSAAPALETSNTFRALGSCFNTIALIYARLGDKNRSLEFHRKALAARRKVDNRKAVAQSYNNIANLFKDSKDYDSAMAYYDRALKLKTDLRDRSGSASTLNNMGDVMLALDRLAEAEDYFLESLDIKKQDGNRVGEVYTQNNLARLALIRKDYPLAAQYLDMTERGAQDLGLLDELRTSYELRVRLLKETRKPAAAFQYTERLMAVKDSLLTREKAEALAEIQTAYEIGERDRQIELLEKETALNHSAIQLRNAWVKGLSLVAILAMAIIVLVYWQYLREQHNKKRIQTLLQELHHRVKNNLQILSSVLSLHAQELTDEQALQAVRSSESRVNAMALIHRKLYPRDQARSINIKEYITELITYLVHTYGYYGKEIRLNLMLEPVQVDIDKAIPLGLIINELISNAFKHAYVDHPAPELQVELRREGKSDLCIDISDNGNGIRPPEETRGDSFGLRLVNMLMSELKGKYETSTQQGTRYCLTIPIS